MNQEQIEALHLLSFISNVGSFLSIEEVAQSVNDLTEQVYLEQITPDEYLQQIRPLFESHPPLVTHIERLLRHDAFWRNNSTSEPSDEIIQSLKRSVEDLEEYLRQVLEQEDTKERDKEHRERKKQRKEKKAKRQAQRAEEATHSKIARQDIDMDDFLEIGDDDDERQQYQQEPSRMSVQYTLVEEENGISDSWLENLSNSLFLWNGVRLSRESSPLLQLALRDYTRRNLLQLVRWSRIRQRNNAVLGQDRILEPISRQDFSYIASSQPYLFTQDTLLRCEENDEISFDSLFPKPSMNL
ncbi:hypothetical protein BLNAU_12863 [Blattamonas nauphoetae]|uniref:Uncharacterized protein n=1 Tax=Blattamonas nauphoetae TaxID=2049346 RepID=A0ABQ9XL28_9EUKA|nr:hypothetical protein BLNAU_12863 [Blattamonas nauphoetae]